MAKENKAVLNKPAGKAKPSGKKPTGKKPSAKKPVKKTTNPYRLFDDPKAVTYAQFEAGKIPNPVTEEMLGHNLQLNGDPTDVLFVADKRGRARKVKKSEGYRMPPASDGEEDEDDDLEAIAEEDEQNAAGTSTQQPKFREGEECEFSGFGHAPDDERNDGLSGFEGGWFRARIEENLPEDKCKIKTLDFDDEEPMTVETKYLRPLMPKCGKIEIAALQPGDLVDHMVDSLWWQAKVMKINDAKTATRRVWLMYPATPDESQVSETRPTFLRRALDYDADNNTWVDRKTRVKVADGPARMNPHRAAPARARLAPPKKRRAAPAAVQPKRAAQVVANGNENDMDVDVDFNHDNANDAAPQVDGESSNGLTLTFNLGDGNVLRIPLKTPGSNETAMLPQTRLNGARVPEWIAMYMLQNTCTLVLSLWGVEDGAAVLSVNAARCTVTVDAKRKLPDFMKDNDTRRDVFTSMPFAEEDVCYKMELPLNDLELSLSDDCSEHSIDVKAGIATIKLAVYAPGPSH